MTDVRKLVGSSLILLALTLGVSLLVNSSAAKPENSSGVSVEIKRQNLVDPALKRASESYRIYEAFETGRKTAEQGLPSGLPEGLPQTTPDPILADGLTVREEINSLIELYAAKYGVNISTLEKIVECESHYDPEATGLDGERGLAQFLSSTWLTTPEARFGWDAAYHPAVNIEAAAWMLSQERAIEWTCLR